MLLREAASTLQDPLAAAEDRLAAEVAIEIVRQRLGRVVASLRLLAEAFADDRVQVGGHRLHARSQGHRLVVEHGEDDLHRRVARERRLAEEELVQRRAEAVDVGSTIDVAAAPRLLRRHVRGRAEEHASLGDALLSALVAREAEVHHDRAIAPLVGHLDEDVPGLHVAVKDAERVPLVQRARDVAHGHHLLEQRHAGCGLRERPPSTSCMAM